MKKEEALTALEASIQETHVPVPRHRISAVYSLWEERIRCIKKKEDWPVIRAVEDELSEAFTALIQSVIDPSLDV